MRYVAAIFLPLLHLSAASAIEPLGGGAFEIYTDGSETTPGLVGSYVDANLRSYTVQDDWRVSQTIAGTRVDPILDFTSSSWGVRSDVGLTAGSDSDWELFSVQWDGFVRILDPATTLATISDDASRMWIDLDGDSTFSSVAPEFIDNNWGQPQAPTLGDLSVPLAPGLYRIRIQYEEEYFGNTLQLISIPTPTVRCAYLIPANRVPQPNGVANLQQTILRTSSWYCEQMDRLGYGQKSFRYETEPDGLTPKVHVVTLAEDDSAFHGNEWGGLTTSATNAGVPVWTSGELWLLIGEIHVQQPDGSIIGGAALGAGGGSGPDPGVAMVGSAALALASEPALYDETPYGGLLVPEIGPYPLVSALTFPWFEGTTVSSIVSSFHGALAHEMGHALGLPHDWRNDANFHGNLMYNGLRGFRGVFAPDLFPGEDCRLSESAGLILHHSAYFEDCSSILARRAPGRDAPFSRAERMAEPPSAPPVERNSHGVSAVPCDLACGVLTLAPAVPRRASSGPSATILTSGAVGLVNGQVEIQFTASDDVALASAHLRWNGNAVSEMPLGGVSTTTAFRTPFFDAGASNGYEISVYDEDGNRTSVSTTVTPPTGGSRAPQPFFQIVGSRQELGELVTLDASLTTDPDNSATQILVSWDLNDDGVYEVGPTVTKTHTFLPSATGTQRIRLRAADPQGNTVDWTVIALRTLPGATVNAPLPEHRAAGITCVAGPNPAIDGTTAFVSLNHPAHLSIRVYDVQGRLVRSLAEGRFEAGRQRFTWDRRSDTGRRTAAGVYFLRLKTDTAAVSRRVVLLD